MIFLLDVLICLFSLGAAYLLRFEFTPPQNELRLALGFLPLFLIVRLASFYFGKTYAGIIRYTGTQDAQRITVYLLLGSIIFCLLNAGRYFWYDERYFLPFSIIFIDFLMSTFLMIGVRLGVKVLYSELKNPSKSKVSVIIFGAGESGIITKRTIDRDSKSGFQVVAFVDDDERKAGKKLEGVNIFHSTKTEELFSSGKYEQLIISVQELSAERKKQLIDLALKHNVQVMNVPPVKRWIKGELSLRQLREVKIEDLLGRPRIELDKAHLYDQLHAKRILVTGAAGSIGSELVRQILNYEPAQLFVLDQGETPMYELQLELALSYPNAPMEFVIGDVRQLDRMRRLMDHAQPQIVFHAAAYKHVPLMEENPSEAVLANVLGSKNMVDLSDDFKVEQFVLVSTDKAVNPTSVMGATKRVAEIYAQSKNEGSTTQFITTRFGNVLGSNGSVIPLFKKQIEEGGPLSVTHAEVTRYFMTIPEAAQLVLEAGTLGDGGEIFVFDMGESVRIIDLAKNMIRLSGLELDKDIEIKISGLRPGEKLFEELLSDEENTVPTHHPKILKAKVRSYNHAEVAQKIGELIQLFGDQNNHEIVRRIKDLVPEYKSQNSPYSQLD